MNKTCRGNQKKQEIVNLYNIIPISYVKLLNGQNKKCCCNDILTSSYYTFSATHKQKKEEYSFFAGEGCARKFLELLNLKPLPLFSPLITEVNNNYSRNINEVKTERIETQNIHPVNKELLEAISLLSIVWDSPLMSMNKIVSYTRSNYSVPNTSGVVWFNDKVGKDIKRRTLSQMLDDLRQDNPMLRYFGFEHLKEVMKTHFPDKSIFF